MITPRLNSILNNITGKTIADIGTDHAYIPINLAMENKITHAVACDIMPGPLEIAKKNINKYGFSDIIELRLGSGLEPLRKNEVETVVIAGMGGEMIINILKNEKSASFSEIILQPMNFQAELRKWLLNNDFAIISEDLSLEGFKVYNLLKVKKRKQSPFKTELEYHLPEYLRNHSLFEKLFEKKKREFTKILNGLKKANLKNELLINKYSEFLKEMENYDIKGYN